MSIPQNLHDKQFSHTVVLGLGYVGLPLALEASLSGHKVTGLDLNNDIVTKLNSGSSHVDDIADSDISKMVQSGFLASTDSSVIKDADVVVICVPTPLDKSGGPNLDYVVSAGEMIGANLQPGCLVILESTTYPGTTQEVLLPILETKSKLSAGKDFFLAFSPERIDPGNPTFGLRNTPKVVGGLDKPSLDLATAFYENFIETVIPAKGLREAETAKLLENTYRHVNIALVNEMAKFCHEMKIDIWDVIRCASTKPFGFQPFTPGPGVGGHCIPIDPSYLSFKVKSELGYPFRFVELAEEINRSMPNYVYSRIQSLLNDRKIAVNGSRILLLGVTYKPNISDQRESPAEPLANVLIGNGALVDFYDPFVAEWRLSGDTKIHRVKDLYLAAESSDIVVLLQQHSSFDLERLVDIANLFLDTKGATKSSHAFRL